MEQRRKENHYRKKPYGAICQQACWVISKNVDEMWGKRFSGPMRRKLFGYGTFDTENNEKNMHMLKHNGGSKT